MGFAVCVSLYALFCGCVSVPLDEEAVDVCNRSRLYSRSFASRRLLYHMKTRQRIPIKMTPITGITAYKTLKSEVLITLLTFEVTSSFPVEDVLTRIVVPVPTPVVESTFSVFVTVEESTSPDDVL